jgi:phosphate transport system protein
MTRHFVTEIEKLKKGILHIGALVEETVQKAVRAVEERDKRLAEEVIQTDEEIDSLEVALEEECLKVLALYQPVARDLRFIIAILKINNDLERIGDLAVSIAERTTFLTQHPEVVVPFDIPLMAEKARQMLKKSLDALVNTDSGLAHETCASDEEMDALTREMYSKVESAIQKNPGYVASLLQYASVGRNLERIADHTTNIAEEVIYMLEGEIIRHKPEKCAHPTSGTGAN